MQQCWEKKFDLTMSMVKKCEQQGQEVALQYYMNVAKEAADKAGHGRLD